jgi:predicted GIY-YIG superfamily endonuclease
MDNQQPSLDDNIFEGSTTIPKGSTENNILGKRPVYLKRKNVIYKITNIVDNKFYIGSASFYDKRIGTHINKLRNKTHFNKYLQNAWNKYGENSFEFSIIEQVNNKENLIKREQYYLDLYKSYIKEIGYNINKKAESRLGGKMPESAKIKIGNFWRGKKHSLERIKNLIKDRTLSQGRSILVYDKDFNFINEYPSLSETSRQLKLTIAAICRQCQKNKRTTHSKYNFRYKDIV